MAICSASGDNLTQSAGYNTNRNRNEHENINLSDNVNETRIAYCFQKAAS